MVSDLHARIDLDRERRVAAKPPFTLIDVPSSVDGPEAGGMLPPPGSVAVFVGDPGAPQWRTWCDAVARGDWASMRDMETAGGHPDRVGWAAWADEKGALDELLDNPVYFEVRCAGRTLYGHGALPKGAPWGSLLFPYTGGALLDTDFEIVEYRLPHDAVPPGGGGTEDPAYVIVRRPPRLSPLERQLLDAVDPSMREIHLGPRRPHDINCVMDQITNNIQREIEKDLARKHAKAGVASTFADGGALPEEVVGQVIGNGSGPAASVGELLRLRRDMLGGV